MRFGFSSGSEERSSHPDPAKWYGGSYIGLLRWTYRRGPRSSNRTYTLVTLYRTIHTKKNMYEECPYDLIITSPWLKIPTKGSLHNPGGAIKELLEVGWHHDGDLLLLTQLLLLALLLLPLLVLLLLGGGRLHVLHIRQPVVQNTRRQLSKEITKFSQYFWSGFGIRIRGLKNGLKC